MDFSDIIEVQTCSKKRVNKYLERGYRLLAVETQSHWTKPPKDVKRVEGFVLKQIVFVVGRTAEVEHFDPDKAEKKKAAKDG